MLLGTKWYVEACDELGLKGDADICPNEHRISLKSRDGLHY